MQSMYNQLSVSVSGSKACDRVCEYSEGMWILRVVLIQFFHVFCLKIKRPLSGHGLFTRWRRHANNCCDEPRAVVFKLILIFHIIH